MRRDTLFTSVSLALLLCGCPNRQTTPHVVYVPSPPPAVTIPRSESSGNLVIEEPAPPEPQEVPVEVSPQESKNQKPATRPRRRALPSETPVEAQPAPENADRSAPPVPALQPRESPQQQTELQNKVLQLQHSVKARIAALERTQMANIDRRTLNGARMFVAQSDRALKSGDQQRAFNLARKASLLVDALEQKP
ncbi:MAG: hypothetical protein ACYDA9_15375 [Terriglobia bacterium]